MTLYSGIDDDLRRTAIESFHQSDAGLNRAHGGSGLGPTLGREICELMGAQLNFDPPKGDGFSTRFLIPLVVLQGWKPVTAQRKTVLLVENDEFTRFMMRGIIGTLGVAVTDAKDGDEGCETLCGDSEGYGLVLMDLHMRGLSGTDATNRIRGLDADPPSTAPIIAVKANVRFHDSARVAQLGMDGFASKPVSPGHLPKLIDRYCAAA